MKFLTLAFIIPLATGCFHTLQTPQEQSPEQRLDLYTTTATYLYEDDDLLRAQEQAVKALEIDSDNEEMRRMIGWIRLRLGSNEDLIVSERFFRDLIKEGDENPVTVLGLAIACERLGNAYDLVARAIESGTRAPERNADPKKAAARSFKQAKGYWLEAIERIEGMLTNDEGSTDAMNALQRLYASMERFDESLAWSIKLLDRTGEELEACRRILTSENVDPTDEAFFREQEARAHELRTQTNIFAATLLFKQQKNEEALTHLDDVVAESPRLAEAYSIRAQLLSRLGEYQRAIEDLDKYLSLSKNPNDHPDIKRAFEIRSQCERELSRRRRRGA